MNLIRNLFFIVLSIFFFSGCTTKNTPKELAVYHWKTTYNPSNNEITFLKENTIKKIYTRYFDLGNNRGEIIPIAPIQFIEKSYQNYEIIPVIYIKNEVFTTPRDWGILAKKTADYIRQINQKHQITIHQLQLDCDWSLNTREAYFQFIELLKNEIKVPLSATIRLHQIKYYQKTGVPPVDKGVLMYYNMGDLHALNQNSIYDAYTANKYISYLKDYPLYVDVALPIFSWGVLLRKNKIVNLLGEMRTEDAQQNFELKKIDYRTYKVLETTTYNGILLQKDDQIKIEEISEKNLQEMMETIQKYSNFPPKEIILYDLKESNITHYEKDFFKTLCEDY